MLLVAEINHACRQQWSQEIESQLEEVWAANCFSHFLILETLWYWEFLFNLCLIKCLHEQKVASLFLNI